MVFARPWLLVLLLAVASLTEHARAGGLRGLLQLEEEEPLILPADLTLVGTRAPPGEDQGQGEGQIDGQGQGDSQGQDQGQGEGVAPLDCDTLWAALSSLPNFTFLATALENNAFKDILDQPDVNLTVLAPSDSVWEDVLSRFGLEPEELYAKSSDVAKQWSFLIVRGGVTIPAIQEAGEAGITLNSLLPYNKVQFGYRPDFDELYVSSYSGESLVSPLTQPDGTDLKLCSGNLLQTSSILLPNLDQGPDSEELSS